MMKTLMFAAAAALLLVADASAADRPAEAVAVRQPWSRPAAAGTVGVGYMTLVNSGAKPATLVGAESPAARAVEMHRSEMAGGVMTMSRQTAIVAPAKGSVTFAPGGYHLMFMGLTHALKPGDKLPATLIFEGGRRIRTDFVVGNGGPPADVTKK